MAMVNRSECSPVLALVDRDGHSYSFHVANVTAKTLRQTIVRVVDRDSYLMTHELASYTKLGREFSAHGTVNHSANEYVRFGGFMHVNSSTTAAFSTGGPDAA
jgi:hypothetical protein